MHLFSTVTGRGHCWFTQFCRGHDILTGGNVIICHGYKILISGNVILTRGNVIFTFTFMHLADDFIQSDLQWIQSIIVFVHMCVPWELNPQPFVLLTQCSTTEPQEYCLSHEIDKPTWPQQPGIIRDGFIHILFWIKKLFYYYRNYYIIKLIYWP